jgi:sugar phosphate permease
VTSATTATTGSPRRWAVLGIGTLTQASTTSFAYGIAVLVPALRQADQLSLLGASVVVTAPAVGLLLTLIASGAAADRYGERIVIATGVGIAAVLLVAASFVRGAPALAVLLLLAGAGAGSVNAASGRMVMGWFSVAERGLAMGIRQTAQPVGVAIAAISLPPLADHVGAHRALLFPAALCALSALSVLLFTTDPPRPPRIAGELPTTSPYRGQWVLWRIHAASALLVIPQFTVSTFTLVYLVGERDWSATAAGRLIFAFQLAGALGRIASGVWSDRVGSRLRPMRQLAVASAVLMAALALGAVTDEWWIVAVFGLAAVVTVADNGLAYIAVAEIAGSGWAGRALGTHNTGQNIVAIAIVPALAAVIEHASYGLAFALVAVSALAAVPTVPVRAEAKRSAQPAGSGRDLPAS